MKQLFFLSLLVLCCLGCGPDYIFEEDISMNTTGWSYEEPVRFEFNAPDTTNRYNLWLTINHNTDYAYENIYINIKTEFPNQTPFDQRLSLDIADKFGNWEGDCNRDRCLTLIPLQGNLNFREVGEHAIIISQDTRDSLLVGINTLSLSIEKRKEKN